MSNVIFKQGTRAQYDAAAAKDSNTLYWLSDTQELFKGDVLYGKGAEATAMASGLMSAADKTKLDALSSGGAIGLTAVDASVVLGIGGNSTTIGVQVSKEDGNALKINSDGLFVSVKDASGDPYSAGDGISVENETISLKLSEAGANGLAAGDDGLSLAIATADASGAMSAEDKTALDSAVGDIETIMASIAWSDLGDGETG